MRTVDVINIVTDVDSIARLAEELGGLSEKQNWTREYISTTGWFCRERETDLVVWFESEADLKAFVTLLGIKKSREQAMWFKQRVTSAGSLYGEAFSTCKYDSWQRPLM